MADPTTAIELSYPLARGCAKLLGGEITSVELVGNTSDNHSTGLHIILGNGKSEAWVVGPRGVEHPTPLSLCGMPFSSQLANYNLGIAIALYALFRRDTYPHYASATENAVVAWQGDNELLKAQSFALMADELAFTVEQMLAGHDPLGIEQVVLHREKPDDLDKVFDGGDMLQQAFTSVDTFRQLVQRDNDRPVICVTSDIADSSSTFVGDLPLKLKDCILRGKHMLLTGATATGKTLAVEEACIALGAPLTVIRGSEGLEDRDLIASVSLVEGNTATHFGPVPEAKSQHTKRVHLYAEDVSRIHQAYVDELQKHNALDFDDLVVETSRMLVTQPDASKLVSSQFHYILVDEFQDTSDVEWSIVKMMASVHGNICVVGDAKQSIFSFRGSNYQLMDQFKRDYPKCHIHMLDTNYRSATRIIDASERLIRCSKTTPSFGIHPDRTDEGVVCISHYESDVDEATAITFEATRLVNSGTVKYSDIAILFRQHWVSATPKECLESTGVPFRAADADRDDGHQLVVECLKMIAQPSREELLPKSQVCAHIPSSLIIELQEMYTCGASTESLVRRIIDYTYGSDWQSCPEKLTTLWSMSTGNPGPAYHTLHTFFEKLSAMEEGDNTDSVQLMSIHQSKGLEFPVVFLIGLEEGVLPSWQAIDDVVALEEERRLCYVAMTRAMDRLYLSACKRQGIKHQEKLLCQSRFLDDLRLKRPDSQTLHMGWEPIF